MKKKKIFPKKSKLKIEEILFLYIFIKYKKLDLKLLKYLKMVSYFLRNNYLKKKKKMC